MPNDAPVLYAHPTVNTLLNPPPPYPRNNDVVNTEHSGSQIRSPGPSLADNPGSQPPANRFVHVHHHPTTVPQTPLPPTVLLSPPPAFITPPQKSGRPKEIIEIEDEDKPVANRAFAPRVSNQILTGTSTH